MRKIFSHHEICHNYGIFEDKKLGIDRDYRTRDTTRETFLAFIISLVDGGQATQMTVRPNEEEQIQMIIKNLLPSYHRFTIIYFSHYWPDFKKLIALGMQEEDSINNGMLKNEEAPKSQRLQISGSNSKFL